MERKKNDPRSEIPTQPGLAEVTFGYKVIICATPDLVHAVWPDARNCRGGNENGIKTKASTKTATRIKLVGQ